MIPKQSEVELPLLRLMAELGGEARPRGLYEQLARHFPDISDLDLEATYPHSGRNRWEGHVQYVRQKLVEKEELAGDTFGIWSITRRGRSRIRAEARALSGTEGSSATNGSTIKLMDSKALGHSGHSNEAQIKAVVDGLLTEKATDKPRAVDQYNDTTIEAIIQLINERNKTSRRLRLKLVSLIERDSTLSRLIKRKRGYFCQICGPNKRTTFRTRDGVHYVETHHLDELSRGGLDIEENILVVCATCHRKFHYGNPEATIERLRDGQDLKVSLCGTTTVVQNFSSRQTSVKTRPKRYTPSPHP